MRALRRLPAVAALLAAIGVAPAATPAAAQTTFVLPDTGRLAEPERALLRLEQARSAAIARHDTAALRAIYADEFRGVTAAGLAVDRERLLGVFALDDPTVVFAIDELAVRRLTPRGDAAIVTGRLRTLRRSGELVAASRFLHVYVWRDGRWQITAAQGTAVRDATSPPGE